MESMMTDARDRRGDQGGRDRPVLARFARQVADRPAATAIVGDTGVSLTYAELDRLAGATAADLARLGVRDGDMVGLPARRTPEMVVSLLGVLRAGAAYVPLDPTEPAPRLAAMAERAGLALVLDSGNPDSGEVFPAGPWRVHPASAGPTAPGEPAGTAATAGPAAGGGARRSCHDVAYVLFTSGSTGEPKGVMVTDRNLAGYLDWAVERYGFAPGDRALVHSPVTFDFTLTCLLGPLVSGGCVELVGADGPAAVLEVLTRRRGYGVVKLTPSHLQLIGTSLAPESLRGLARTVVVGGEALLGSHLQAWKAADPDTVFVNEYGPTEATVGCCAYVVPAGPEVPPGPVPIGRPVTDAEIDLLDDAGRPVAPGDVGEIYVSGACVARGYLGGSPADDAFEHTGQGARYRTGDLARVREDGELVYIGRRDTQVKVRGHRVELGEVEAAMAAHPAVLAVAATVRTRRNGENQVVAFVTCEGEAPPVDDLRRHVAARLPEHMVPAQVVCLPDLPLTRNGKVDRRSLPTAGRERPVLSVAYVPPAQPLEAALVALWADVLELDTVGVTDDFFDLGGDSLMAAEVIARAESEMGLLIRFEDLFERPSVRGVLGGARP